MSEKNENEPATDTDQPMDVAESDKPGGLEEKIKSESVESELNKDLEEKKGALTEASQPEHGEIKNEKDETAEDPQTESLICEESVEDLDDDEGEHLATTTDDEKSGGGDTKVIKTKSKTASSEQDVSMEVEVSNHSSKKSDDGSVEGVVTRRSQRRRAKPTSHDSEETLTEALETKVKVEESMDEEDELESVSSELDSLTSGSTLTTRSALRRRNQNDSFRKSVSKKQASKSGSKGKQKNASGNASLNSRGKSRRAMFKKVPLKAPSSVARAVTSERVFHNDQYFTRGDIVSVTDIDGGVFYAQLRGFLTDQYCEKSCVITWLLPTKHSPDPDKAFDPATYVIGPEEEFPRKLDYFSFVMHAPDNYFYYQNAPYPTDAVVRDQEYIVTRMGPRVRLVNTAGKVVYTDFK